jgi:hypothetical protein
MCRRMRERTHHSVLALRRRSQHQRPHSHELKTHLRRSPPTRRSSPSDRGHTRTARGRETKHTARQSLPGLSESAHPTLPRPGRARHWLPVLERIDHTPIFEQHASTTPATRVGRSRARRRAALPRPLGLLPHHGRLRMRGTARRTALRTQRASRNLLLTGCAPSLLDARAHGLTRGA